MTTQSRLIKQLANFLAAARREDQEAISRNIDLGKMARDLGFRIDWRQYQLIPMSQKKKEVES